MATHPLLQWAESWGLAAALISERQQIEAVTPLFGEWAGRAAPSLVGTPVDALFEGGDDLHTFLAAASAFLATVSHELRTPMNALLGWTRLLTAGSSSGRASG